MSIEALNNEEFDFKRESRELQNEVLKPWKVTYLRESNDKKYDVYAYKLSLWGTRGWVKNKYIAQIGEWKEWTQFADDYGKPIDKKSFKAWEIVYLRVPKWKEKVNNNPEFTENDLKNLSDKEIKDFYALLKNEAKARKAAKKDAKWTYQLLWGKKLYYKDMAFMTQQSSVYNYNWLFLHVTQYDSAEIPQAIVIWSKKWRNIEWIYIWEETNDKIYRGKLKNDTYWPIPSK